MLSAPSTRVFYSAFMTVVVVGLSLEGNKARAISLRLRERNRNQHGQKSIFGLTRCALYVCESERELFRCLLSKGYTFFIKAVRCGYKSALYPQQEIYKRSVG